MDDVFGATTIGDSTSLSHAWCNNSHFTPPDSSAMASNNIKLTVTQTETRPDGSSTATTATVEIPLGQAEVAAPAIEDAKPNYIITTDGETRALHQQLPTPAPPH